MSATLPREPELALAFMSVTLTFLSDGTKTIRATTSVYIKVETSDTLASGTKAASTAGASSTNKTAAAMLDNSLGTSEMAREFSLPD